MNNNTLQKSALATVFLLLLFFSSSAQENTYSDFYSQSLKTNNTGMYILGGWAAANIVGGAIGWANSSGSTKYFHQMNLFWNTVNLGIAGFAVYSNHNQDWMALSETGMLEKHLQTERLYLINTGLDVVYIGTGYLLMQLAKNNEKRYDLLKGYGNSVMLQGGFLFVFDLVMLGVQRSHRLQFMENMDLSYSNFEKFNAITATFTF